MKKIVLLAMLLSSPACAQAPAKSFTFSGPLVEEIFQRLSTAALLTMLQSEAQHQPPPVTCPEAPAVQPAPPAPPAENK